MWSLKPGFGAIMLVMVTKSSPCAFSLSLSLSLSISLLFLGQDDSKPRAGIRTQFFFPKRSRGFICCMFWQRAQGNPQHSTTQIRIFSKSLDHRQKLIGLRLGTKFFIYGMNGSKTLSEMHTRISLSLRFACRKGSPF